MSPAMLMATEGSGGSLDGYPPLTPCCVCGELPLADACHRGNLTQFPRLGRSWMWGQDHQEALV